MPSDIAAKHYLPFADYVYIDAEHDYWNVNNDLVAWYPNVRVAGGILAGDDYGMPPVKLAWDDFADTVGIKLKDDDQVVWTVL
jgi:hypothetical protein